MNWHDVAVQSALIQAIGALVAAIIASICATIIGKKFADRKRLEERLAAAQNDISFLLQVEQEHCEMHRQVSHESFKLRVRRVVEGRGHTWSGRFTPGRLRAQHPQEAQVTQFSRPVRSVG